MGKNWKGLGTLTLIGLAAWTSWAAKAQDEPNSRLSLPVAAPQAGTQFPPEASSSQSPMIGPGVTLIRPGSQTSGFSSGVGTKGSVAQLRNPFEWEGSVEKHGLFGWIAPQTTPQYPGLPGKQPGPEPVAPPGGLPGEIGGAGVAQPGAVAAPSGAEAMPGAGGEPGAAPSPGATTGAEAPATTAGAGAGARSLCLCCGHDRTWVRRSTWRCCGSVSHDRRSWSAIPQAKSAFSSYPHADSTRGSQAWQ